MLKIKEAIIVEGRYDKIKLSSLVDTPIIQTNGFRIFSDKEKQNLVRKIAENRGILIMTDSDGAGFVIRNFLNGVVDKSKIKHCYIPQISGKEKRKSEKSKEGYLGVEGISDEIIINSIKKVATIIDDSKINDKNKNISKSDLFILELTGTTNAKYNREKLLKYLDMPTYLSTNAMLTVINSLYTYDELKNILNKLIKSP